MADVVFVVVLLAFFGLASLFVSACERVVGGPDLTALPSASDAPEKVAA